MKKGRDRVLALQITSPISPPQTIPSSNTYYPPPVVPGVEAFNAVVSARHNKFNNFGGSVKAANGERRKLGKFEVLGRWMGRYGSWLHGMADQLFVGDHTVMDCCKIKWDEAKGTYVQHSKEDPIDMTGDTDWFDGENSLPMEAKIEVVEEMVMKTEEDDAGWNSEEDVNEYTEGDDEIVRQGKALALLDTSTQARRKRTQNPNHTYST